MPRPMKSEAEIKALLAELYADRLALGRLSSHIVAKPAIERNLYEQRFPHSGDTQAQLRAINLQIALLEHILNYGQA